MKDNNIYLYTRLLHYIKPYWLTVVFLLIATAIYSSTNAIYASKLKDIIDEGFIKKDMDAIYVTIKALILVTFFRGIGFFVSNYTTRRISSDIVLTLRREMFSQLHRLPSRYFDKSGTGEVISRFNYDVSQVTDAITNAIVTIFRESVLVLILLGYLFYQNWLLTLLIFALAPFIGIVINIISKRLKKLSESIQDSMGSMNHILGENIRGQKIIKVYNAQNLEQEKFDTSIRHIRNASIKSEVASSTSTPIIEMLIIFIISIIIWLLARDAKFGNLTAGSFMSYTVMMALLPGPIKKLMRVNEILQRGAAASKSIFSFLDDITESPSNFNNNKFAPIFSGEIKFQNVGFSYLDNAILSNFNLRIVAGETTAIVGISGSGKSSIVSLIPRFYEIDKGRITLDNIDISDMDLSFLRKQIAFVSQETILFDDSITNNIAYGEEKEEIDINKVKEAAKLAYADEFILKMKSNYDSNIGESGKNLSGGQKQRLAIARAIYKNAPIIILDEATSALDNKSERKVQLALDELLKNRTAIIIAHRLSTIKRANRIVVLDKGQVVEEGSYEILINSKGKFYHLNNTLT